MRIAMVSEHASPLAVLGGVDAGGQNVHVAELARALARLGAEVTVHTRRDAPELPRRVPFAPGVCIDHVEAGPPQLLPKDELLPHVEQLARGLSESWRAGRPDVVHAHFWMSGLAALSAARELDVPVVQTFHALGVVKRRYQGEKDTSPPERVELERGIVRRAQRILATCTDEVFELMRLGADRAQLAVIPCGVDLEQFTPVGPAAGRRPGMRRLVTVGRLVERKGIGNVISALAQLPRTELIVAGGPARDGLRSDPEARRLLRLAEEEGVADRVQLCGRLERAGVAQLLRSADVVVAVPWYEPFGVVPLEAMACGVPVVAAAVGGMIDTVVDGVTGVQVPPRDPERLAGALRALLDDPARRDAYGRAGAERARRLYDWGRVGAATLNVYAELAGTRRRRRRTVAGLPPAPDAAAHLSALHQALERFERSLQTTTEWAQQLSAVLLGEGRLLVVGNGGSAAQAQHLTAELVGRFEAERRPVSALCLHADSSSYTAICNDYGPEEAFARQVRAHGRPGDALMALSTSGESPNVLAAVRAARGLGMSTWGLCGPRACTLSELCDEALCVESATTATVQELHMVAIHVLCAAVEHELVLRERLRSPEQRARRGRAALA